MSVGFSIRGLDEAQRALAQLDGPELKKVLQKGVSAGAKVLKPHVQRETPKGTGLMRRKVTAKQARRERPAAIVHHRVFYRKFVIEGTKAHRIRFPNQKKAGVGKRDGNIEHPGAKPNPIMTRAWASGDTASLAAVNKVIHDYLEAL